MVNNHLSTSEPKEAYIAKASVNDQATEKDSLGFEPYVTAIAEFLTNSVTQPPLTLSIEGELGSGKSSFMKQLQKAIVEVSRQNFEQEHRLKQRKQKLEDEIKNYNAKNPLNKLRAFPTLISIIKESLSISLIKLKFKYPKTVWFNAWRHDKAEALWAAFALAFLRQISQIRRRRDIFRVLKGNIKLFFLRFDWKNGFQTISLVLLGLLVVVVIVIVALFRGDDFIQKLTQLLSRNSQEQINLRWLLQSVTILFGGIGVISVLLRLFNMGNPKNDLTKYLRSPNYQDQVPFVENFHEDFKKIVEAFAGKNKVYVFIDDLDRCEVPKSAELMQAINMMISNDPQLIFILGMDRDKVAAGLAIKYKQLIPYLVLESENRVRRSSSLKGMDYAYTFMEKFIQLPFQVPRPNKEVFHSFLEHISRPVLQETKAQKRNLRQLRQQSQSEPEPTNNPDQEPLPPTSSPSETQIIQQRIERIKVDVTKDSTTREIALMVSCALYYNPRRIKQFINLFRLKALIAASTGLFDSVQSEDFNKQHLTLEQLGKFTAIILKWPRLLVDLDADHALMKKLQNYALSVSPNFDDYDSNTKYWGGDAKLVELLRYSDKQETQDSKITIDEKYSLEGIDIGKLLQVSPRVTRPKLQSEKGIHYTRLENLLKAGQWKEADYETYLVILQAVGRSAGDWIRDEELLNFPCTDLRTIDSLWVKYSNGRFGFSVQKLIYLEVGGIPDGRFYEEAWKKFAARVGWRVKEHWIEYSNVIFNTSAPEGHLPEYVCYEKHIHERWSILSHRCL